MAAMSIECDDFATTLRLRVFAFATMRWLRVSVPLWCITIATGPPNVPIGIGTGNGIEAVLSGWTR